MKQTIVHAIFDIGKTNKKLFLFDEQGEIIWKTATTFPTIEDEDGFTSDDLSAIEVWMVETMTDLLDVGEWDIKSVNFSGFGASLVYLDESGKRLPLFIDYLKPYPEDLAGKFLEKYGPKVDFCRQTASPWLGMLNSGLQIYWLKYMKPEWFEQVRQILHFPQYLSYLFSKIPVSEYTSIGCHTGMWDYTKKNYHQWIYKENIIQLLPPVVSSDTSDEYLFNGKKLSVGSGLHDTSASLIPYLKKESKPFLLLSTGTWALAVNPFSNDSLSSEDLANDCLNFLRIDGKQVRTARLFLGREHGIQTNRLSQYYDVDKNDILGLNWDADIYEKSKNADLHPFDFEHLDITLPNAANKELNSGPGEWALAYYQLMDLLVPLQIEAIHRAAGTQDIPRLIIEGGFVHNRIFIELLRLGLPNWEVRVSDIKGGSARGVFELINL